MRGLHCISVCRDGDWVRVYGILKALGNSKIVTIFALTKIVDFNEVTYHFLDAMQAHMTFTKPVIHVCRDSLCAGA